ncbi:MAG: arsenate reductase (glutaredoxin) [Armatimonadetes bacterium]|nr:arsenate reductase (glutaredoxin) [Armatimonadota bacterium]
MVTIYHNPRCSKSRAALALLEERGVRPEVRRYLEQPPTIEELSALLDLLGLEPLDVMRRSEAPFRQLDLGSGQHSREELLAALVAHPVLLERPIVVSGQRAVLGRPPEKVLELL